MFEQQIRMSRADRDRKTPRSHRWTSPTIRSRSISPNDMAVRQRRATVTTSYPDVVISHTPTLDEQNERSEPSSDIIKDFKSRLAMFDRPTTTIETVPSTLISKSAEKIDPGTEFITRLVVPTRKAVTFFAGQQFHDPLPVIEQAPVLDILPEHAKSNKSSLFSGVKKVRMMLLHRHSHILLRRSLMFNFSIKWKRSNISLTMLPWRNGTKTRSKLNMRIRMMMALKMNWKMNLID